MENKKLIKDDIKKKILEIFDAENRPMNTRELTMALRKKYGIVRSEPIIKKYLVELVKEDELDIND